MRIRKKNVYKNNGQFVVFPHGILAALCTVQGASILPECCKIRKYLLKNFVCEETEKTVKKFQSDPEESLNKLPIKEIDTTEQIL